LKALTFKVQFLTAQFKDHMSKVTRRTYLIPPPSAVAGFFGAILGLSRKELAKLAKDILAGAELKSLGGRIITLSRVYTFDREAPKLLTLIKKYYENRSEVWREVQELSPITESEELYMPKYKFAIASSNESLVEEGMRRLKEFDFEYEVFGGNDYHFVHYVGDPKPAKVYSSHEGYGYCPREDFERIDATSYNVIFNANTIGSAKSPIVMPVMFLAKVNAEFVQVYGAKIVAKRELTVVDDGESRVFVYEVDPFLVVQI